MNHTICMAFIALMTVPVASGAGDHASALVAWGSELEKDPRVAAEVQSFEREGGELGEGYAARLAEGIRGLVFSQAGERIRALLDGECEPFIDVSFPDPGFAAQKDDSKPPKTVRRFESSFVRTEVLACLETDVSPEEALGIYTSPAFRMRVSSRINRIWDEGDEGCIEIDGVKMLLSPTLSCNSITELRLDGLAAQHSQVVSNSEAGKYQRVYFKESLKVFVAIPGGLALYYINYARASDLGGLSKFVARRSIASSQEEAIQELRARLAAAGGSD